MSALLRAWLVLVAASAATTLVAYLHLDGLWVVAFLLALALVKSRAILSEYLRLKEAPEIRRGFTVVFVLWACVAMGLAAAAAM